MKIALLASLFVIFGAGCAGDSPSSSAADEVVAAVEEFHPGATDISCAQSSGVIYACRAVVDGDEVTYRARANSDGVYLNSSPDQ